VVTRYRSLMLLVAVLFVQLLVMAYQLRRNQDVPIVRGGVVYIVAPIQRGLASVVHSFRNVWEGYVYLWGTRRQNQMLSTENDRLKLENQRLLEQAEQGRRLQVLFDLRQQLPLPTVAAQVLSAGSSETARIVMIDKGSEDGLKPDLAVLVPDGVVGKILHVFPNTAQVLLLTDAYSGVATLLADSRIHGVVKGQNKAECTMTYVPNGEEVKPGQIVYTSGEDQIFPKGLPVGVVLEAQPGPEFQQITIAPLAKLNRLEEVLVILQSGGDIGSFPVASSSANDADAGEVLEDQNAAAPITPPSGSVGSIIYSTDGNIPNMLPAKPDQPAAMAPAAATGSSVTPVPARKSAVPTPNSSPSTASPTPQQAQPAPSPALPGGPEPSGAVPPSPARTPVVQESAPPVQPPPTPTPVQAPEPATSGN
jgi:rod shape-determining protein MreC